MTVLGILTAFLSFLVPGLGSDRAAWPWLDDSD
jgi:hypothetical protein